MPYERIPLPVLDAITRRSGIRRVLLVILAVSLLPLAVLSSWNGVARLRLDAEEQRQKLAEAASLTASSELNVIQAAEGVLELLADNADVRSGAQGRCGPPLAMTAAAFPAYSHLALIGADGKVRCASRAEAVGSDVTRYDLWHDSSRSGFSVSNPLWGEYSKRQVLWAMLPLQKADGSFDGALSASIDLAWLKRLIATRPVRADTIVLLVDGNGRVIAASRPVSWSKVPLRSEGGPPRPVRDSSGTLWDYAVAPLHISPAAGGASYHILYAAPQPRAFGPQWWIVASTFALPVLALLLASFAIWFGANRAILRWIGHLGRLAGEIGAGNYRAQLDAFEAAPHEMRGLAADLHRMGRTIAERDRTLNETLDRQRALTFELHHRVRNNLQIIASYLSLQAGRADGVDAGSLDNLRLRVAALAMVHRLLFDSGDDVALSTGRVLDPLCPLMGGQSRALAGFRVHCEVENRPMSIDTAIPMTLWVVEAAEMLAMRGSPDGDGRLTVSLAARGDGLTLAVEASGLGPAVAEDRMAARLLASISRQLGGRLEQVETGATSAVISVNLPAVHHADGNNPGVERFEPDSTG